MSTADDAEVTKTSFGMGPSDAEPGRNSDHRRNLDAESMKMSFDTGSSDADSDPVAGDHAAVAGANVVDREPKKKVRLVLRPDTS